MTEPLVSPVITVVMSGVLPSTLALLHAGGWDEILYVAVALGMAWGIITWTGRSRREGDDEGDEDEEEHANLSDSSEERGDPRRETVRLPIERRDDA